MQWFKLLSARLYAVLKRDNVIADIDDEFRLHVDLETKANLERGMSANEARRTALKSFGNVGSIQDAAK